jgi:hypothetical protein
MSICIYTDNGEDAIDEKLFLVKLSLEIAKFQTIEHMASAIVIAVQ